MKDMKKYGNSQTKKNLETALSDEALSHVKYMLWGNEAERMGYPQIANCYRIAANNELAHAKMWMGELGMMGSLNENLQNSIADENPGEHNYRLYARDEENEGYDGLGEKFLNTAQIEKNHADTFSQTHRRLVDDDMFTSNNCSTVWMCYNCGYSAEGESPPQRCPLCGRPESWFIERS